MTNVQFLVELIFGVDTYDPACEYMLSVRHDPSIAGVYDIFSSASVASLENMTHNACDIHRLVTQSLYLTWTVESISIWFNGIEGTSLHTGSVHFFICGRLEWHKYIKCAFHTSCTSCMVCGMLKIRLRQSRGYLNDHIVTRSRRWSYDEISILFHCRDDRNNAIWNRQLHSCCMWSTNRGDASPDDCWQ